MKMLNHVVLPSNKSFRRREAKVTVAKFQHNDSVKLRLNWTLMALTYPWGLGPKLEGLMRWFKRGGGGVSLLWLVVSVCQQDISRVRVDQNNLWALRLTEVRKSRVIWVTMTSPTIFDNVSCLQTLLSKEITISPKSFTQIFYSKAQIYSKYVCHLSLMHES